MLQKALILLLISTILFSAETIAQKKKKEPKEGFRIGNRAPELAFKSPQGKIIKLSDLRGKMVLLDFWASWCPPCREENPNLVKAYHEFKDKNFNEGEGFTIYSLSMDSSAEAWKKAIADDKLVWPNHVSDLGGWHSAGAKQYKIWSIPMNYLINKDGIIVAKRLNGELLHKKLEKLMIKD